MKRPARRFQPNVDSRLEERVVLSRLGLAPISTAAAARRALPRATPASRHQTLTQLFNTQYAALAADLKAAENAYLDALGGTAGKSSLATTTLTAPMDPAVGVFQVASTAGFPVPTATAPVQFNASSPGGAPLGLYEAFGLVGNAFTQVQIYDSTLGEFRPFKNPQAVTDPPDPPFDSTLPAGTVLQAVNTVSASDGTTFLDEYQSYLSARLNRMAQDIITRLNQMPVKLPRSIGPPRFPGPRNAIQLFVYRQLVGSAPDSLLNSLLAVDPPASDNPTEVQFYDQSVANLLALSHNAMLNGVQLIFSGKDVLTLYGNVPVIPAYPAEH